METKFTKQKISAYAFVRYMCATLAIQGKVIVDLPSITKRIHELKMKVPQDLKYMFYDIEFRNGINSISSNDISEGLNSLQTFGVIGKMNPTYSKVMIYLTREEANEILSVCNEKEKDVFKQLADCFE